MTRHLKFDMLNNQCMEMRCALTAIPVPSSCTPFVRVTIEGTSKVNQQHLPLSAMNGKGGSHVAAVYG